MKKQLFNLMMSLSIMISCTFCTYDSFAEEGIKVSINGEDVVMDVAPEIINGRTLVPLRSIFEGLGAEVTWDSKNKTAIGETKEYIVKVKLNSNEITRTNKITNRSEEIEIDVPATSLNGRTLVPTRAIAETLEKDVHWDRYDRAVVIVDTKALQKEIDTNLSNLLEILNMYSKMEGKQENEILLKAKIDGVNVKASIKVSSNVEKNGMFTKIKLDFEESDELIEYVKSHNLLDSTQMMIFEKVLEESIELDLYADSNKIYVNSNITRFIPEIEQGIIEAVKGVDLNPENFDILNGVLIEYRKIMRESGFDGGLDATVLSKDGGILDKLDVDKLFENKEFVYYDDMQEMRNTKNLFICLLGNNAIKKTTQDEITTYSYEFDGDDYVNSIMRIRTLNMQEEKYDFLKKEIEDNANKVKDSVKDLTISIESSNNIIRKVESNLDINLYTDDKNNVDINVSSDFKSEDVLVIDEGFEDAFSFIDYVMAFQKKMIEEERKKSAETRNTLQELAESLEGPRGYSNIK